MRCFAVLLMLCLSCALAPLARAEVKSLKVDSTGKLLLNDQPAKLWGIRAVCAAAKDEYANQLIETLKDYKEAGANTLLVCYQGGPGLSLRTFAPDGASFEDTATRDRMRKIIEAANQKDMLVIVSLFFPRKMGVGGQDPKLASREAYIAACKTAAEELKKHKNVIVSVYDQPIPSAFGMTPMKFTAPDILECLGAIASVAPDLPRGGGSSNHEANVTVSKSDAATVVLHTENGLNIPAFPVKKPIIHVAFVGNDQAGRNPQGCYHPVARQPFSDMLDRYADASTAHFLAHFPAWYEGGLDLKPNRFDIGGPGTIKEPGLRWYFDALERRAKRKPVQAGTGTNPGHGGSSIFDFPNGPKK